ncbi:bifunctional diguanylate cyclase/phosphodiesterase [Alicyclobacillus sp. SO9]|uniref:putative bifunctional diguanylate cyclase/phosphodiesterase n=1 Tax=Alicyclobacillus sp. SO9 TaxID=2665646 RepID=UPI0018E6F802|nr:bifunctional diguanylate cyclase/phosphodiesterase [Alicyclobacillus sp. SO9]QQE80095.1 bifunctional diguanylate cyclase/phosphodiesterase [Alicyclobacillus sp. SO9]
MQWWRNMTRAWKHFLLLSLASVVLMVVYKSTGAETLWVDSLRHSTRFQFDDILVALFVLLVASSTFAAMRWRESSKANRLLEHQTVQDSLTGVLNRRGFFSKAERMLNDSEKAYLVFIDSNRFKFVNDTYGHATGNQLLIQMAQRLMNILPENACLGRLGGDEFAVLIGIEEPNGLTKQLQDLFEKPFIVNQHTIHMTVSLGVSVYPCHGETVPELLQASDLAMYEAKRKNSQKVRFYDNSLGENLQTCMSLQGEIHEALINNEFFMVYQPIIHLSTGAVFGCEGLVRWNHPVHGVVYPASFIPLAEESSSILSIGKTVIRQVLEQKREWEIQGLPHTKVSINVSAVQFFNTGFIGDLEQVIAEHGLNAQDIIIEITERILMPDDKITIDQIARLREMGCLVSIDDFGAGFSSIHYLTSIEADIVKLDQTLVRSHESDSRRRTICHSVIQLAHELGLTVVAEGIENPEEVEFLRQLGCDYVQGYFFGYPMSSTAFSTMLLSQQESAMTEIR